MISALDNKQRWLFLIFVGLLLFALFSPLDLRPLRVEEPRRAVIAMEMMYSGNYIVPTIHGINYFNKPPIYNWVVAGLFTLFGSFEEWVVRMPTVISLLLTALLNFFFVRKYYQEEVAVFSSLFYILSADILLFFSMLGEIDMFFTLIVYTQIIAIFHFFQKKKWLSLFLVSYLFTAIGVLTKGVPSLAFQALTLLAIFSYNKRFWLLFGWQHILGILLLAAIGGGYFYTYSLQADVWPYVLKLFVESSSRTALESHPLSTVFNFVRVPLILVKLLLPWSFFLILLIRKNVVQEIFKHPLLKYSFFFFVVNISIYCLSPGTRDRYLYMFLPFVLLILTHFYVTYRAEVSARTKALKYLVLFVTGLVTILLIVLPFTPQFQAIPNALFWSFLFAAIMGTMTYFYYQKRLTTVWALLITMLVLRFGVNTMLIPFQNSLTEKFQEIADIKEMVKLADGEPIYLAGEMGTEQATFEIQGNQLIDKSLVLPPFLHYMITFYFTREQQKPLLYHADLQGNTFYVSTTAFAKKQNAKILYNFITLHKEHCLFQLNVE